MKKIGKREAAKNKRMSLFKGFQKNFSACIKKGVIIAPECVVYNSVWRIVIEYRNEDGGIKERLESDDPKLKNPKSYYTPDEYEIKIMELTAFYAESF